MSIAVVRALLWRVQVRVVVVIGIVRGAVGSVGLAFMGMGEARQEQVERVDV